MAPSKQTGIYWKMHYNKEFSFGLFFTSEHQRVGIIPDRISDLCPTTESKWSQFLWCWTWSCFSSHQCKLGAAPLSFTSEMQIKALSELSVWFGVFSEGRTHLFCRVTFSAPVSWYIFTEIRQAMIILTSWANSLYSQKTWTWDQNLRS